jgi:hypothetical protein
VRVIGGFVGWALTSERKGTENGLDSKFDHDHCLCVNAAELYMILYKYDRNRIDSVVGHRWVASVPADTHGPIESNILTLRHELCFVESS